MTMLLYSYFGRPAVMQIGYLDTNTDHIFRSGDRHAWIYTPEGIVESTAMMGETSPLVHKQVRDEEWDRELDYIRRRAEALRAGYENERVIAQIEEQRERQQAEVDRREQTVRDARRELSDLENSSQESTAQYYQRLMAAYREGGEWKKSSTETSADQTEALIKG